jgi:hypothetical protein
MAPAMALMEERMSAYLAALDRLVQDGGDGNFVVFEDTGSGLYVQAAGSRSADAVLVDVPTGGQDAGDEAGATLESMGFEETADAWFEVDRDELGRAGPEATEALHGWIAEGRDPGDERVARLETHDLLERQGGPERTSYQTVLPPERAAYVIDKVFRRALAAPEDHDVRVEIYLEGEGSDVEHVTG